MDLGQVHSYSVKLHVSSLQLPLVLLEQERTDKPRDGMTFADIIADLRSYDETPFNGQAPSIYVAEALGIYIGCVS
jgi:hypothetical protein